MKKRLLLTVTLGLTGQFATYAQDPDIDRLLKKLPAPEKVVTTQAAPGVRPSDPILQDPLASELDKAMKSKNVGRAVGLARKLSVRHPKSVLGHFLRGSLALESRQFSEAAAAFRQAASMEPRFAQAQLGLGVAEIAQLHFAAALPHIQRFTQLEPKLVSGWMIQSALCARLGRKDESARAARQATQLAPKSALAWRQLAQAENALGHHAAASQAMERSAQITPYLDTRIPPPKVALPALRRAAQAQPKNSTVHFQLGSTLRHAGLLNEAVIELRKSINLNPKFGPAWQQLGLTYRKLGRDREANAAFAEADRLMPHIVAQVADAERTQSAARMQKSRRTSAQPEESRDRQ